MRSPGVEQRQLRRPSWPGRRSAAVGSRGLGAKMALARSIASCSATVHEVLAAAVVAACRDSPRGLGLVSTEPRSLAVEDRLWDEVLRGDHRGPLLPSGLVLEHLGDLRIDLGDWLREEIGAQVAHRGTTTALQRYSTLSHDLPGAVIAFVVREVEDGGRRAQLAAVEDQVDPARSSSSTSATRAPAPPARFALDWSTGQLIAVSGASAPSSSGTRRPSRSGSGPHASG